MPNWTLSDRSKTYLRTRALELSNRALYYAEADFPLTATQIQYSVMPAGKVDTLRNYISQGTQTIEKHTTIRLAFLRQSLPELQRGAVVNVALPARDWIVVDRSTQFGMGASNFSMEDSSYLVPDFGLAPDHDSLVSPTQREELVNWINRAIRQKRLHDTMKYTLGNILQENARTVGHLQSIWPMLCTLMNDDPAAVNPAWAGDKIFYETWRERFRAPRRNMGSYKPAPDVLAKYSTFIRACDAVLAAGSLLAPYVHDKNHIAANLVQWERLNSPST